MAHLNPIEERRCEDCSSKAKTQLFNSYNLSIGFYCKKHGAMALKKFQDEEASLETKREDAAWLRNHS
jgi:hypothetical protein